MPELHLKPSASQLYHTLLDLLWAAALISLPFTSFPLLVNITGAIVTPLAAIPVFLLIILWFIPYILRRGSLPRETTPLVIFFLVVLLACSTAFFVDIPGFKGRTVLDQELRALVTLIIGMAFFLITSAWPQKHAQLRKTWQWLNLGGILATLWTLIQAYYIVTQADQFPIWYEHIQEWLVYHSAFSNTPGLRVTGLTYEASWFAHQMVILYIPLWLSATFLRTSAFKLRIFRISIENILLVIGVFLFFLTSPRIGLISFFLIGVFIFIKINLMILHRLVDFITKKSGFQASRSKNTLRILVTILTSLLMVAAYVFALVSVIYLASQRDWRLLLLVDDPPTWTEILGILTLKESILLEFSHRLAFMERMVYWLTGWHIFNDHPLLGVGLGNAGFFALEKTPSMGWASYEIRMLFFRLPHLPNIKSFWVRLFAETGLAGVSTFIAWLVILIHSTRLTLRSNQPALKTFALYGQISLVAFIGEGFSIDSFAMPYLWVTTGLIAASGVIYRKTIAPKRL